jgi:hypothetical protein
MSKHEKKMSKVLRSADLHKADDLEEHKKAMARVLQSDELHRAIDMQQHRKSMVAVLASPDLHRAEHMEQHRSKMLKVMEEWVKFARAAAQKSEARTAEKAEEAVSSEDANVEEKRRAFEVFQEKKNALTMDIAREEKHCRQKEERDAKFSEDKAGREKHDALRAARMQRHKARMNLVDANIGAEKDGEEDVLDVSRRRNAALTVLSLGPELRQSAARSRLRRAVSRIIKTSREAEKYSSLAKSVSMIAQKTNSRYKAEEERMTKSNILSGSTLMVSKTNLANSVCTPQEKVALHRLSEKEEELRMSRDRATWQSKREAEEANEESRRVKLLADEKARALAKARKVYALAVCAADIEARRETSRIDSGTEKLAPSVVSDQAYLFKKTRILCEMLEDTKARLLTDFLENGESMEEGEQELSVNNESFPKKAGAEIDELVQEGDDIASTADDSATEELIRRQAKVEEIASEAIIQADKRCKERLARLKNLRRQLETKDMERAAETPETLSQNQIKEEPAHCDVSIQTRKLKRRGFETIDVTNLDLCDGDLLQIAKRIERNSSIDTLLLGYNMRLSCAGLESVFIAIGKNRSVHNLGLQKVNMSSGGIATLAPALASMTKLNLWSCSLDEAGVRLLAGKICNETCASLTVLELGGNSIGDAGARAFASALESTGCNLRCLSLRGNQITDSGISAIASALKANKCLTDLSLRGNAIGNEGALHLSLSLRMDSPDGEGTLLRFRRLDLSLNEIDDKGATALATSVVLPCQKEKRLELRDGCEMWLGLSDNRMSDDGITTMASAVRAANAMGIQLEIELSKCLPLAKNVGRSPVPFAYRLIKNAIARATGETRNTEQRTHINLTPPRKTNSNMSSQSDQVSLKDFPRAPDHSQISYEKDSSMTLTEDESDLGLGERNSPPNEPSVQDKEWLRNLKLLESSVPRSRRFNDAISASCMEELENLGAADVDKIWNEMLQGIWETKYEPSEDMKPPSELALWTDLDVDKDSDKEVSSSDGQGEQDGEEIDMSKDQRSPCATCERRRRRFEETHFRHEIKFSIETEKKAKPKSKEKVRTLSETQIEAQKQWQSGLRDCKRIVRGWKRDKYTRAGHEPPLALQSKLA